MKHFLPSFYNICLFSHTDSHCYDILFLKEYITILIWFRPGNEDICVTSVFVFSASQPNSQPRSRKDTTGPAEIVVREVGEGQSHSQRSFLALAGRGQLLMLISLTTHSAHFY